MATTRREAWDVIVEPEKIINSLPMPEEAFILFDGSPIS
jgi:hypothetical protein